MLVPSVAKPRCTCNISLGLEGMRSSSSYMQLRNASSHWQQALPEHCSHGIYRTRALFAVASPSLRIMLNRQSHHIRLQLFTHGLNTIFLAVPPVHSHDDVSLKHLAFFLHLPVPPLLEQASQIDPRNCQRPVV